MVCLGNICRSPLAEGILKTKAQKNGLDWVIESAGTYGGHAGEKADRRSRKVALENGIDISDQRSRQFSIYDFEIYDIIYAMDSNNVDDLLRMATSDEDKAKIKMIMNECNPDENINVPDPYYGEFGFQGVYEMLDKASEEIIKKYK